MHKAERQVRRLRERAEMSLETPSLRLVDDLGGGVSLSARELE